MKASVEQKDFSILGYAWHFFRKSKFDDNLNEWNNNVLIAVLKKINFKLDDLIEDEIEGNEQNEVPEQSLQIINIHGNVSSKQGNVAIGQNINQTISQLDITKEFVSEAINKGIINEEREDDFKKLTIEIDEELKKENPNQEKLSRIADGLFSLGGRALLKLGHGMIDNLNWKAAASNIMASLI